MGTEEIARNEQFLLLPQCFLLKHLIVSPFVHTFDIIFLFAAELEEPKISICGKGLKSLDSHIYVVVYSFLEFWKVSK